MSWLPSISSDTILYASIGGLLLGVATSLNYIIRGKVTGMSGIAYGIVSLNKKQLPQKLSIVGGMLTVSSIAYLYFSENKPFGSVILSGISAFGLVLSGFLVGFGTKLSNGCTSGHGLCGLPRFSVRSLAAVCTFLSMGILTSTFVYGNGENVVTNPEVVDIQKIGSNSSALISLISGLALPCIGLAIQVLNKKKLSFSLVTDHIVTFIVGSIFSLGLILSGMSQRQNILSFLKLSSNWNPSLLFVLGSGLMFNLITFTIMKKRGKSLNGNPVFNPKNSVIDWRLVAGAALFGIGWGIGGLCPGPFFLIFPYSQNLRLFWGLSFIGGMLSAAKLTQILDSPKNAKTA